MINRLKRVEPELCALQTKVGLLTYTLSRSPRRRSLEITITDSMNIRVLAPRFVEEKQIVDFIHEKASWIERKLKETDEIRKVINNRRYCHGHVFMFLGKKYALSVREDHVARSRIAFDGHRWEVIIPYHHDAQQRENAVKQRLIKWYRTQAKEVLGGRIFHYTRIMDVHPKYIIIKTQKRIWGSCDFNSQKIHLNWQLVFCPIDVIDYVIVHELCHLHVPNHSKRFWRKVAKVLPDYKVRQKWFKVNATDMILP